MRANAAFESLAPGCHIEGMTEKPKRPRDANQLAKFIVDQATGEDLPPSEADGEPRGRAGGLKGGPARAKKLSAGRRREIGRAAASARWQKSEV